MKDIILGNTKFKINKIKTQEFYNDKDGFSCECKDCINYTRNFELIIEKLEGLDKDLGIDITKDVGIGMEELIPSEKENYHLYYVPYYVYGEVINKNTWSKKKGFKFVTHKIDKELSIYIKETEYGKYVFEPEKALTLTFIFTTPLVTYKEVTGNPPY